MEMVYKDNEQLTSKLRYEHLTIVVFLHVFKCRRGLVAYFTTLRILCGLKTPGVEPTRFTVLQMYMDHS